MEKTDEEFLEKLFETFRVEAEEHLRAITVTLTGLEQSPEPARQAQLVETLFREVHSLKGAARSVNQSDLEKACQALENVCVEIKAGAIALTRDLFDQLHRSVDLLASLVHEKRKQPTATQPALELVRFKADASAKTVRIPAGRLNAILLQSEEMRSVSLGMGQCARELRALGESVAASRKEWENERPELRPFFRELSGGISGAVKSVEHERRAFSGMLETLLDDVRKALMLPASSLLEVFPKLVRDLSGERGKRVELAVSGGEVEIDRRILEELKDPLMHLARNAIDHAVEKPEARQSAGKPPAARLEIAVSAKSGDQVEVVVRDDGAGVDRRALVKSAVKAGLLSLEKAQAPGELSEQEVFSLMFRSGVSTAPVVTDLSGRGLGLAIVQEKVERLGGAITVESREGLGTAFRIALPTTLATFRGILVESRGRAFVVPTANVERVLRVEREDVKTVEGRDTIPFDGKAVAFAGLGETLRLPAAVSSADSAAAAGPAHALAMVLRAGQWRIAFGIDGIRGEQDILVKQLGPQLKSAPGLYGATVLGDGSIVPILHVPNLMESAAVAPFESAVTMPPQSARGDSGLIAGSDKRRSVLVVEDSVTSRTLLKNILEAAGFSVKTAVDGLDALATLRTEPFDLVVSDIDMPRMDGLALTSKIRGEEALARIPVVLVTASETRETRERGIEAGANAYVVKSRFDQGNLVEIARRLVDD